MANEYIDIQKAIPNHHNKVECEGLNGESYLATCYTNNGTHIFLVDNPDKIQFATPLRWREISND